MAETKVTPNEVSQIWYEELGRASITSGTATSLTVNIPQRKYLKIIKTWIPSGGSNAANTRFNGDTGTNYNIRYSQNNGTEITSTGQTSLASGSTISGGVGYSVMDVINIPTKEKVIYYHEATQNTAGSSTPADRYEIVGKWANSTNPITSVTIVASGNTLDVGTELVVLGHD